MQQLGDGLVDACRIDSQVSVCITHTLNTPHHTHPLHGATQFAISIARLIDLFLHSSVILCFCRFTYIEAILRTRVRERERGRE